MEKVDRSEDKPERLPRGRHGLSREKVEGSQRRRILAAIVEVVAERGYAETRVVDVIDEAKVSRKTFYELFADKEECFLAAFDAALGAMREATSSAFDAAPGAPWPDRIRLGLAAALRLIAEQPAAAKFCIVDAAAAGQKALVRRDAAVRQLASFIDAGRSETRRELPGVTALSIAGGINQLLYTEILRGAGVELLAQLPEIVYWTTQPFLGAERAAAERELARSMLVEGQVASKQRI